MRILLLGAGVIGSVYAGRLLHAGHDVVLLARGQRLADLRSQGLVLEHALSGDRETRSVAVASEPAEGDRFDLVLVLVRADQVTGTLPVLAAMTDGSDVLFLGNTLGRHAELAAGLGQRVVFGFPAVGGVRDGPVVRYVVIRQQKTMLGESDGTVTARVHTLQAVFDGAGFPTRVSTDIDAWMVGHTAFVVPLAFALYRVGVDPAVLASDPVAMRLMVRATGQGFVALRAAGNTEIPVNLRLLYQLPVPMVVAYWRRVLAGPRGEVWFAGHTRAAPEEMRYVAQHLQPALRRTGRPTPDLDDLLGWPA